jgi:hypothetical protein
MKQTQHSIKSHRYELVHGEGAEFIAYQRKFGDGLWQTISTWMIPRTGTTREEIETVVQRLKGIL